MLSRWLRHCAIGTSGGKYVFTITIFCWFICIETTQVSTVEYCRKKNSERWLAAMVAALGLEVSLM